MELEVGEWMWTVDGDLPEGVVGDDGTWSPGRIHRSGIILSVIFIGRTPFSCPKISETYFLNGFYCFIRCDWYRMLFSSVSSFFSKTSTTSPGKWNERHSLYQPENPFIHHVNGCALWAPFGKQRNVKSVKRETNERIRKETLKYLSVSCWGA